MEVMPISVLLLGYIPETILLVLAALTLIGEKPKWTRLLVVGVLNSIAIYYIRQFSSFGPHIVYQSITLLSLLIYIIGINPPKAFLTLFIGGSIAFITETVTMMFSGYILGNSFDIIMGDSIYRLVHMLPQNIILLGIIIIARKKGYTIINTTSTYRLLKKYISFSNKD